jgi:hypothetical protein
LLADRAFDANWVREALAEAGIEAVIPPKSNRRFPAEFDRDTYNPRYSSNRYPRAAPVGIDVRDGLFLGL